jgi:SAM-dependent methyltransferase
MASMSILIQFFPTNDNFIEWRLLDMKFLLPLPPHPHQYSTATAAKTERLCPVCINDKSHFLFTISLFKIVKCSKCGHIYVQNPEDDTSLGVYPDININKPRMRHIQITTFIKNNFSTIDTLDIAEIGTGYGQLAKLLEREIPCCNYTGYETGKSRYDICKENGINVINAPFVEKTDSYDVIVIDNVLEHVMQPVLLLQAVSSSLKRGGIAIIIVPNRNDLRRLFPKWKKRHYWIPHSHINYFSYADMIRIGTQTGLAIKNFDSSSLPRQTSFALKIKTLLDNFCIHIGGLYLYGRKR